MVYNGILMETIGIAVMVSIGPPLFFLAGLLIPNNFSLANTSRCHRERDLECIKLID